MWNRRGSLCFGGRVSLSNVDITMVTSTHFSCRGIVISPLYFLCSLGFIVRSSSAILLLYSVLPTPALEDFTTRTLDLNEKKQHEVR